MFDLSDITGRTVAITIGTGVLATAFLFGNVSTAAADPPPPPAPGCSAGDFEQLKSQVASATATYMFTHPDVNAFFSTLKGQPKDQTRTQVDDFFAGNPQAQSELAAIRQPLRDMKDRCQ
ncbi:MAG: heme-binding protein [Mycobacterium sp.]|jgi:hemophore-related protein|nr:heme-binding protein [Mycobacterium sp.]